MHITERLAALRDAHHRAHDSNEHRHGCCEALEEHLDEIEAELAEILSRLPAAPDATPAHITLTAS